MPNVRIIAKGQRGDRLTKLKVTFAPEQSSTPSLMPETESVYLRRATEGTGELMELVGGSVAWNQRVSPPLRPTYTEQGVTVTRNSLSGTYVTLNGTATADGKVILTGVLSYTENHIWLCSVDNSLPTGSRITMGGAGTTNVGASKVLFRYGYTVNTVLQINFNAGTTFDNLKLTPCVTDLTQMFGSTIADYAYALEQQTAGSGIAWLQSYGFFTEDYIAYSAPTLQSVEATSHIAKDGNGNVISTTTFGSVTLRGITELVNGTLRYNGDTYEWDGTVTRNFGERAYQAGDESLTDAITDGTNTVYKLTTPTTESADPFTAVQTVEDGGTEEFVTTNNVPVGVVGRFANAVPMEGVDNFTVTANDGTTHTYPVTLSEEIYRGYVDMLTGEAVSDMASIAEYNGETIAEPWLSSLDVYALGATPTKGAQVVYPVTPEEVTATITGDPTELGEVTSVTSTKGTAEWSAMAPLEGKCIVRVVS